MPIKVQIIFDDDAGGPTMVQIERDALSPATLGPMLEDAKEFCMAFNVMWPHSRCKTINSNS